MYSRRCPNAGAIFSTDDKSIGYKLVDGETDTVIGIDNKKPWEIKGKPTPLLNYSTVTLLAKFLG
jgi:hypothetical protein